MNTTHLTAEPLNVGATEIGAPSLGQVHILQAKSLTTKRAEIGGEPPPDPGVHRLKAARWPPKRTAYRVELCRIVLRERLWPRRFPSREELPHREYLKIAKHALKTDPRTRDLPLDRMRKTIMRAGYRERLLWSVTNY
jgi:hypothetical protein